MYRIKRFCRDTGGSETTEMVMTTAMLCTLVLVALMFLTYIAQLNMVNTAVRRVVRNIEVTGIVQRSQMEADFDRILGSSPQMVDRAIDISNAEYCWGNADLGHIQLKRTFCITGSCNYEIPLVNPGSFTGFSLKVPLSSSVTGMSEVYWRS